MIKTQTASAVSAPLLEIDIGKLNQDLNSAALTIQSLIDREEGVATASIRYIPSILQQAQEKILEVEARLQQSELKLAEAQQIAKSADELQTLLDLLPVGIIISKDPQNQIMEINRAGSRMLNVFSGSNPSKSAPEGDQLPFKVLRNGHEVPPEELPMQYATTHKVAIHDIELDVQHVNGKVLHLLEYASPIYDKKGILTGSLGVMVDITLRKSIEQRLAMQYQIAHVLAESTTINNAAAQILQMICETTGLEYAALWQVELDSPALTNEGVWFLEEGKLSEYAEAIQYSILNRDDVSLPGAVFRSGQPLWLSNIQDFHSQDAIDAENAGFLSAFILPVFSGNKVIAVLECLSMRILIQDDDLAAMLNAVCSQVGIFIERKLLEQAITVKANQQQLLAQAGFIISNSLDYEERLQAIVHVIVPDMADWCGIDLIDKNNILRRVAAAHVDPSKTDLVYQNQPTRPIDPNAPINPQFEALRTGLPLLFTDIPESLILNLIVDPIQLDIIRQLKPKSTIVVPLIAHGRILGLCTFVQSDSGRRYVAADLGLAEGIARHAALALDNANLYSESQKLNADLENRVEERTSQLKAAINQLQNQIAERQTVENQVRILNAELEHRIAERTAQLEVKNSELYKEVVDHQKASLTLRKLLKRTREMYRISQTIGTVRTPNEILNLLLSSSYLKDVSRASIAILEKPWFKDETPPGFCFILAEWNRGIRQPRFINKRFSLEEYGIALPIPFGKPIVIQDIQSVNELSETVRKRFADLRTHSLIILPLIAGGEWFGLLSLHFKTRRMTNLDDLLHVRGLVDETAIVTKNMRLLETESQARQEAERANDLKLKFLGMISHELRTPLTAIKGFATTLLAEDVSWSSEKQHDFLETINTESDKLHDLIEQLLDLSRMEAGTLRISLGKASLNNVVDSASAQLQAVTTDHKLVMEIPPGLPQILCDEQRIAQVLTNLITNAAKYSPRQTKITITAHQSGKMVQVDVFDQGPGIPPQDRIRVFEAFRQLENGTGSRTKGAGLGLAICKGLIEAHNGNIWIQDHRGSGTVVSFTIPVSGDADKSPK
jgi:PAS domain S-box-containing protein